MQTRLSIQTIAIVILLALGMTESANANSSESKIWHAINRLSFGARGGDIDRVRAMGVEKYIQSQLNPDTIPENPVLIDRLAKLDPLKLSIPELFSQYYPNRQENGQKPSLDIVQTRQKNLRIVMDRSREAKWLRGIYSDRQLEEVMVNFWFDRFNVDANKGLNRLWTGTYERDAIRPHAMGKFRDLLGATAKQP